MHFSYRNQLFDKPNERKIHTGLVPRLGGVTFYLTSSILCAVYALLIFLNNSLFSLPAMSNKDFFNLGCIFLASTLLFALGIVDDLFGLRYRKKFIGQIFAALILCSSGIWIKNLYGLFGIFELSMWEGYTITIFAIVMITNAINFIDGIDGLAASLCLIALSSQLLVSIVLKEQLQIIISIIIIGSILPFLYHNVFGKSNKGTKIFMGDTGSLFLGLMICVMGINVSNCSAELQSNAFVLAFSPLIVPCFDVIRVVLVRVFKGKNPFVADSNHIHHLLLSITKSQPKTLAILCGISLFFMVWSTAMSVRYNINFVLITDVCMWIIFMLIVYRKKIKTK